jgi:hypothetical protein
MCLLDLASSSLIVRWFVFSLLAWSDQNRVVAFLIDQTSMSISIRNHRMIVWSKMEDHFAATI